MKNREFESSVINNKNKANGVMKKNKLVGLFIWTHTYMMNVCIQRRNELPGRAGFLFTQIHTL